MMERLPKRIQQKILLSPAGCWLWTAAKKPTGYGVYSTRSPGHKKTWNAHRYVYEYLIGPIPEGLSLDHLCRVRHCVNPQHLEPVSIRTNLLRGQGTTGAKSRQTHCIHGHIFDAANTSIRPNGTRTCKRCRNERLYRLRRKTPYRFTAGGQTI
jgi:hypothetical protein